MCIEVIKLVFANYTTISDQVLLLSIKFSDKNMKFPRRLSVSHLKQFSEGTPADSHFPHHHYESLSCQIFFRQLGEDWWHANTSISELDFYINASPTTWIQIFRLLRFRKTICMCIGVIKIGFTNYTTISDQVLNSCINALPSNSAQLSWDMRCNSKFSSKSLKKTTIDFYQSEILRSSL